MVNYNSICVSSVHTQKAHCCSHACKPDSPDGTAQTRRSCLKLNLISSLFSVESRTGSPFALHSNVCTRVIKAWRENTRKWPNTSTVGGLQLVPHEWGLWLRSEKSRSVPMLPYQYRREKKEGSKEKMVIGRGMDTPNKTKNRKCVWSGMVVQFILIQVNSLHFDEQFNEKYI